MHHANVSVVRGPQLSHTLTQRSLGIDHVTYGMFDFSLSFLIYLVITFLVHLYQHTGKNAESSSTDKPEAQEAGYAKLQQAGQEPDGPDTYELTEQDLSGDEDAVRIGGEDEVDWLKDPQRPKGVYL